MNRVRKLRPASVAVFLLVVATPTVIGLCRVSAYAVQSPLQFFSLGLEWVALVFPLLAAIVGALPLLAEVSDGHLLRVRTRTSIRAYLGRAILRCAMSAFAAMAVSVAVWFVVCFYIDPAMHFSSDFGTSSTVPADAHSATFSGLINVSPALYGAFYAAWVGLWAALFAALTAVLLVAIPNRLVALTLPLVLYWAENVVLANLSLPQFRAVSSAFPFSLTQQPAWTAVVPLLAWGIVLLVIYRRLDRSGFQVPSTL